MSLLQLHFGLGFHERLLGVPRDHAWIKIKISIVDIVIFIQVLQDLKNYFKGSPNVKILKMAGLGLAFHSSMFQLLFIYSLVFEMYWLHFI